MELYLNNTIGSLRVDELEKIEVSISDYQMRRLVNHQPPHLILKLLFARLVPLRLPVTMQAAF